MRTSYPNPGLEAAIEKAGGAAALAALLKIHKTAVSHWRGGQVPAMRVPAIEALTGVPRHALRPDLWPAS